MIGGSIPGGISRIVNDLPPSYWSFATRNPLTFSGEVVATTFTLFAAQAAITGVFAAKDHKSALQGAWITGFLIMPISACFIILGMCARIHFGDLLPGGLSAAPAIMC